MHDFIKKAKEEGKIKKYSEVRYTDPDLLEDNFPGFYIGEQVTKYNEYNIGDIVYVKNYVYKDGTERFNHLFVIIDKESYAVPVDYFCMFLSSKVEKVKYKENILLKRDNINGLQKDSIVKTDAVYEFENDDIEMCIGKVNQDLVNKFIKYYMGDYDE